MTSMRTFILTVVVLVIIVGGYFFTHKAGAPTLSQTGSTTSQTLSDGTVVTGLPEGAVITEEDVPVPQQNAPKAPDYNHDPIFLESLNLSSDVKAAIAVHVANDRAAFKKNPQDYDAWLDLGMIYKISGDYKAAESAWVYVTKVWPTKGTAFTNLANLYTDYLKDSAKASYYSNQAAKLN